MLSDKKLTSIEKMKQTVAKFDFALKFNKPRPLSPQAKYKGQAPLNDIKN